MSAIIAFLGDTLGTKIGKQRLSIFGLRPRVTAVLITISTGMVITLVTLLTASMLSDNVRIALFSVQELNKEREALIQKRESLSQNVKELKSEHEKLLKETKELENRIQVKGQALVVFQKNEPILAVLVKGGDNTLASITAYLTDFFQSLSRKSREYGLIVKSEEEFLTDNMGEISRMASYIASISEEMVVGAIATENLHVGESLGQVRFLVRPNRRIFRADQEIASIEVDGQTDRGRIAKMLKEFMEEINLEVVKHGMIGNPLTGRFGDLSSDSMLSFYDLVNQIKNLNRKVNLVAIVKENTFAIGPLNVSFRIEEDEGE
ncbi:DUF3084 domain-containing protein [bacterium]|nr:DUF3084 domain-containing protein [bacterium]